MSKLKYDKPNLHNLETGEGLCLPTGSGDADVCSVGNAAGNDCSVGTGYVASPELAPEREESCETGLFG